MGSDARASPRASRLHLAVAARCAHGDREADVMPRNAVKTVLIGAVAITFALAGCAPTGNGAPPTPTPAASVAAFTLGEELEPGTYTSETFATPLTFTVPAGWKVFEDEPGHIGLARMANDGPPLLVMRDIDAAAKSCAEEAEPNVGRSPEELTSWLAGHEGLVTTDPLATTVGGLDGYTMDTAMEPAWTTVCPFSNGQPIAMTLVGSELSRGVHWGNDSSSEDRLWILDLPNVENGNIVIVGTVCCGADRDDQLEAVQGVVDSFSFDTSEG